MRTHMIFAAASTILTSLRNSGHTEASEGEVDMALEDTAVWPSVEVRLCVCVWGLIETVFLHSVLCVGRYHPPTYPHQTKQEVWGAGGRMATDCASSVTSSEGWEHVALSAEGEQWVFLGEDEEAATAAAPAAPFLTTAAEEEKGEMTCDAAAVAPPQGGGGGMNYRSALVKNLMELGEGEEWPPAPVRRTLASVAAYGRKKKARLVQKEAEEDESEDEMGGGGGGGGGGGFVAEYERYKAVGVRTRKAVGRKRLTETGKRRMAAKLAARAAPRGAGEDEEEGEEW